MGRSFLLISLLLLSSPTWAGSLKVAQWLPWEFVSQAWNERVLNFSHQEDELTISWQELRPVVKGVDVQLQGTLGQTQFQSEGLKTSAQNLSATIKIAELSVNQIVKIELNGNIISVRLEAHCSPIHITIPRFSVEAAAQFLREQNYWRPQLSGLNLQIPLAGWTLSSVSCTGAGGVGTVITQRITQALQDPQTLSPLLQEWLAPQIQVAWNNLWQQLLDSTSDHLTVLSMERPSDKGVLLFAELPLNTQREVNLPLVAESLLSSTHPQLVFSQESLEALMEDRLLSMIPAQYNLQQVEGFRTLMGSRVVQSFVWPDLRRFPSQTPFFVIPRLQDSALALRPTTTGAWQAEMKVEGSLQTFINHAPIDYMSWGLNLKTILSLDVQESVLTLKSGKPTTKMVTHFSGLYVLIYKPNQKLSSSILQDAVQGFFKPTTVTENLPTLKWEERSWKLGNWKQQQNLITMDWMEL